MVIIPHFATNCTMTDSHLKNDDYLKEQEYIYENAHTYKDITFIKNGSSLIPSVIRNFSLRPGKFLENVFYVFLIFSLSK